MFLEVPETSVGSVDYTGLYFRSPHCRSRVSSSESVPNLLSLAYVLMLKIKSLHFHLAQFLEQRLVDIYMLFTVLNCKFIYPSFSTVVFFIFILLIPFKVRIVTFSILYYKYPARPPPHFSFTILFCSWSI